MAMSSSNNYYDMLYSNGRGLTLGPKDYTVLNLRSILASIVVPSTCPCEGRKRTRFTQNMNACRATANSVHTSPYRGLNEAQPRSKRGATAVRTRRYRGQC